MHGLPAALEGCASLLLSNCAPTGRPGARCTDQCTVHEESW